jgi:small-conductance mechanosensitive channel
VLVAIGVAAAIAVVVGLLLTLGLRWVGRRAGLEIRWTKWQKSSIVILFVVVAVKMIIQSADSDLEWVDTVLTLLDVALIAIVGWMLLIVAQLLEQATLKKFPATALADRRSRHARTKIALLHKVINAAIITFVVGAILWTIPGVREVGMGIFASAGVVGIVAGLAAQTSLSNVFAGIQIAFSDGIRIDDIVEMEGQWGRIEDIKLTYVVVRVWDGTSLILPCTYFNTTPFRNWTHGGSATVGKIELGVDWHVSIEDVRHELARILEASPNWDGKRGALHVEDASMKILRVVVMVSAADGEKLAALRWEVREGLVDYIQREQSLALPPEPPLPIAPPAT